MVAAVTLISACSDAGPTTADGNSATQSTNQGSPHGCTLADGLVTATAGDIAAGPFLDNKGHWADPGGAKLWVASKRDEGAGVVAVIVATRMETQNVVTVKRPPEARAEQSAYPTFFPGTLQIPNTGKWKLEVIIGDSRGCFEFDA